MGRVAVLLVVVLVGGTASAQPKPEGERLFEEGRQLAKAGKYPEACEAFQQSLSIDRAPGTEVNYGDCLEHLGQLRRAWQMYEEAAKTWAAAGDERSKFARDRARQIRGKLGLVIVQVVDPSEDGLVITVNGESLPPQDEIKEYYEPGTVEVVAKVPAKPEVSQSAKVVAGRSVIVEIPAFEGGPKVRPGGRNVVSVKDVPSSRRDPARVKLAIELGAGGGVALIASGVLALTARSSYNSALDDKLCVHQNGELVCTQAGADQVSSAATRANIATAFAIGGVALVATGAILFVTAPRETMGGVAITPVVDSSTVGLAVGGSF